MQPISDRRTKLRLLSPLHRGGDIYAFGRDLRRNMWYHLVVVESSVRIDYLNEWKFDSVNRLANRCVDDQSFEIRQSARRTGTYRAATKVVMSDGIRLKLNSSGSYGPKVGDLKTSFQKAAKPAVHGPKVSAFNAQRAAAWSDQQNGSMAGQYCAAICATALLGLCGFALGDWALWMVKGNISGSRIRPTVRDTSCETSDVSSISRFSSRIMP